MAAYCRVSTEKEEQEKSFETQKEMYTERIMLNPHWQMAGIYADEGLTGTIAQTERKEEGQGSRYHDRAGQILQQVCFNRSAVLR